MPLIRRGGRVLDLAAGAVGIPGFCSSAALRFARSTATSRRYCRWPDPAAGYGRSISRPALPWPLGTGYDGIVVTNYLHRPLLPAIAQALAPGGVLIYETFALGNERFGRPRNPDFLLRPANCSRPFRC